VINAQMITIPITAKIKIASAIFFQPMHSAHRPGTQRPVRKQTRDQKQQRVSCQKVIRHGVRSPKCNDNTN